MTTNSGEPLQDIEHPIGEAESLSGHITANIENIAAFQVREQQKAGESQRRLGSLGDVVGHAILQVARHDLRLLLAYQLVFVGGA